jgi:ribosomal protein L7Ae-like RNA K-turn-binding protein
VGKDKAFGYLGLAAKAGKVFSGEFQTEEAIKRGKAKVVVLATDASENTKKHFKDMCEYRKIPYVELTEKEELGRRIGRSFRASLAITDQGLADAFLKALDI